ncbi:MAG: hypothetical protein QNI87_01710 [Erythrobacter sp.]|uniref:hypothetical protein n=1 Tax=Erythrobacter sp. TaxID=1042 RepID=UPI002615A17E|nr:hypothetical protein [Erythrobacter sp.]MDJ0977231.1 hypothetical protein [Erythrobacter sp.]
MSTGTPASLTGDLIAAPDQPRASAHDNDNPLRKAFRRCLVLTEESARHPFRRSLPPRVKADLHDIPAESLWRLTMEDVRGAASVYVATTAAILAFII